MRNKILLLDGAMGTQLQKMGARPGENTELLNLTHPDWVRAVQASYVAAGSRILFANTFGANALKLRGTGHTVRQVIDAGVRIAREAAGKRTDVGVFMDMGPLGALLEPLGTMPFEDAYDLFAEMVEAGVESGVDGIAIETMTDLQEARAALLAAKEHSDLPVWVTMSFDETGRTFTGCTVASMARVLTGLGADAVGVNCSLGPGELTPLIAEMRKHTHLPLIAKPNAGLPDPIDGHYDLPPEEFARAMQSLIDAGAELVGGCCGTGPEYIEKLGGLAAAAAREKQAPGSFICTATAPLPIDGIRVIGERINPTGKKRFQQALLDIDLDYIVGVAVAQMDAGAQVLDVNVGYPGVEEKTMLPRVVRAIQGAVDLPLQLDSADPAALEAALRVYCGKAAVNSVNGKEESLRTVLPLVKKYGASVIGLTLDENGIPDTAEKRVAIAQKILDRALQTGIAREDVWIDCLTLTVSAQQEQAEETLKAIRYVTGEMGLKTVLGVSNISFGLPNRPLMTQTFLIRALDAGLSLPILNPNQTDMLDAIAAFRVLQGADENSQAYIARFANAEQTAKPAAASRITLPEAIRRGLKSDAKQLARQVLQQQSEMDVVEQVLIPALDQVGAAYETGAVFLPQLLSAAQAAQAVFEEIQESLLKKGGEKVVRGRVLMATVQGDVHDIGKNIVKTVLENYGYQVIDLGKDVPPEQVVEAAQRQNIRLVGLSALMTTTLPAMEETVRQLKQLPNAPKVMVGGAVVTQDYARRIGADFYARDARAAVQVARQVFA